MCLVKIEGKGDFTKEKMILGVRVMKLVEVSFTSDSELPAKQNKNLMSFRVLIF